MILFETDPASRIGLSGRIVASAFATDNLGLGQVQAEIRPAGGDWQTLGELDFDGNNPERWLLDLPYTGSAEGNHELRLRATDQSQGALEGVSESRVFTLGVEEAIDDFESEHSEGRWQLTGEWAIQEQRTYGSSSAALGSSDDGFYDAFSAGTALFGRSFDLSQAESAWLELREQFFMAAGLDHVHLELSTDGQDWQLLASRSGVQAQWNLASLDLSAWLGQPTVWLRWRMDADGSDQGLHIGYYADNIRLVADPVSGVTAPSPRPAANRLAEAWPNPFNPSTRIRLDLERSGPVELAVYNVLGQQALRLLDGRLEAGSHEFVIDGSSLASGVYVVRARGEGWQSAQRILLMK